MARAAVLTERDPGPSGGDDDQVIRVAPDGVLETPGGGESSAAAILEMPAQPDGRKPQSRQRQEPDEVFEIIDDDDGNAQGGEARLTEQEVGTRPLLGEREREGVRVYSKEELAQLSPQQRKDLWKGMSFDEQRANRALNRLRKKDARSNRDGELYQLRETVANQQRQIDEMTRSVGEIAPRFTQFQREQAQGRLTAIDNELAQVNRNFEEARKRMRESLAAVARGEEGASEDLFKAQDDRDAAFVRRLQLNAARTQLDSALKGATPTGDDGPDPRRGAAPDERRAAPARERQSETQLSPRAQEKLRDFVEEFPWIADKRDPDIRTVMAVDQFIWNMGLKPDDDEYWEEFEDRLREELPHRFEDETRAPARGRERAQVTRRAPAAPQRRGPPSPGGGDVRRPAGGNRVGVHINQGRREALVDAGILDKDGRTVLQPQKLQGMLKQYAAYDRANPPTEARR